MGGALQLSSDLHMPWLRPEMPSMSCWLWPAVLHVVEHSPQGVPAGFCLKWVCSGVFLTGQGLALNGK